MKSDDFFFNIEKIKDLKVAVLRSQYKSAKTERRRNEIEFKAKRIKK